MLQQVILFGIVGTIGFLVDVAFLYLLNPYFGPHVSRFFSFFIAVFSTWILNRLFTFRATRSNIPPLSEFLSYLLLMVFGGAVNYGCYVWLVMNTEFVINHLYIGVAIGSMAGMVVNFLTSRFMLFRNRVY
jgi:putative flippase GtrA